MPLHTELWFPSPIWSGKFFNVDNDVLVVNVPYSLKVTFVPSWIARTLVTWYFVPSVIWIVYSADRYVATGKLKIAVWDVDVVVAVTV